MGVPVAPATEAAPPAKSGEPLPAPKSDGKPSTMAPGRARLIVELPADAKLFVDDHAVKATKSVRNFTTPVLEPGQVYYYELRAEMVRDGKPVTETKRVLIRAGDVVRAQFEAATAEPVSTASAK